ncbi:4'-phosphopantetheinyl transferase superfamily protein [Mycoplasma sp. Pen4]|uniref:4'-phosphopantetheinyl transferase superfamily protein n=1 Tax=Mycoplasma sp. Pen4 TaxID=640330 RepID=UPI0016544B83|nr:4'-phosphopantetheinyl transferase superfamily protein [Mycoplasma sp. Pen4]QNM93701.1 4'-phosphopantetheinyl transferase superfamily protein [Mycoplasma sp. Pen4]
MYRIGVDLTNIKRFENVKNSFIKRVLSPGELDEYQKIELIESKIRFLARSWAIKEAIYKADNQYADFRKINLVKQNHIWTFKDFAISISYEGDFIIAFVVKEN